MTKMGRSPPMPAPATSGFSVFPADELRRRGPVSRVSAWLLDSPRRLRLAAALYRPFTRLGGISLVTGYDAVKGVLADDRAFPVPFDAPFMEMDRRRKNFILGMPDGPEYRAISAEVVRALRPSDLPVVTRLAEARATALVEAAAPKGEIEAMAGLLTDVPTHLVREYYGVPVDDPDFPLWAMAMSAYAFAGPFADDSDRRAALAGAERLGRAMDAAVAGAIAAGGDQRTVLGRLVLARAGGAAVLTDDVLRATMTGLITGFIPTNMKAGGQILDMLLRRPDMLSAAEAAARTGDNDLLRRCLFEALRFKQTIPVMFRRCAEERVLPDGQRVRKDTWVGAVAQLAAFDRARVEHPWRFDPARGEADSLGFGFGQHRCIGVVLAGAQIAATFRPLLLQGGLRSVPGERGRPAPFASFTERRLVAFGPGACR